MKFKDPMEAWLFFLKDQVKLMLNYTTKLTTQKGSKLKPCKDGEGEAR